MTRVYSRYQNGMFRCRLVIAVVLWIGGVAVVTTVLLPATLRLKSPEERVQFFERVEAGFARQARWTVLITGASGFYLAYLLDAWDRFRQIGYWWMHASGADLGDLHAHAVRAGAIVAASPVGTFGAA